MMISFIFFRVVCGLYWFYAVQLDIIKASVVNWVFFIATFCNFSLHGLNLIWLTKIVEKGMNGLGKNAKGL